MGSAIWQILISMINADRLAGWTRALVAALLGVVASWSGGLLAPFLTPEIQVAIGTAIATLVVGLWSQIAKTMADRPAAQVAALAKLPEVDNRELALAVGPKLAVHVPMT